MARTKALNSKVNIKQPSSADTPLNTMAFVTRRENQTSTAGQSIINLGFAVDQNNKDAFLLVVNGRVLMEGAGNDYTFTAIQSNNTSSQVTLSTTITTAGLPLLAILAGALVQQEPNVNSLQAQITALSGQGQGGINYVTASDGSSITGWATYNDGASANPVDGTAGTATGVTIAQTAVTPLRGATSFQLSKDAANRQGTGVAYDFTIDRADLAQVLSIDFDFEGSTNFAVSDLAIWIYDITNAVLIQPAPYQISAKKGKFKATFQTASNSSSYRVIFHIASTNALAWTLNLDRVTVGPTANTLGTPVTDWQTYTPTFTQFGTPTAINMRYRRVGTEMEIEGQFTHSAIVSAETRMTLPPGYTIDAIAGTDAVFGDFTFEQVTGSSSNYFMGGTSGNSYINFYVHSASLGYSKINTNGPMPSPPAVFRLKCKVPITGWSSNVAMSAEAGDGRVVAARASGAAGSIAGNTVIPMPTVDFDTHGMYSTSTGKFTIPVSGYYRFTGFLEGTNANNNFNVYINGIYSKTAFNSSSVNTGNATGSLIFKAVAGDLVDLRCSGTTGPIDSFSWYSLERLSGPATIAATESINCRYTTTAGQVVNGSDTAVIFGTKDFDSHGAFNPATGVFTAPASGKYRVSSTVVITGLTEGSGGVNELRIYKNNSFHQELDRHVTNNTSGASTPGLHGSGLVSLLAGETVQIYVNQDGTGTPVLATNAGYNWITVERIGN